MVIVYILLAVLLFGILIAVHEFGHFIAAKSLGVKVNEFAIGMGPRILHKQKGETEYTWRLFPIGGFCAMEGEGENSDDPRAFNNKARWKRLIILVAGAFMNFVVGVLIFVIIYAGWSSIPTSAIKEFTEGHPIQQQQELMLGDRILSVDGHKIYAASDVGIFFNRADGAMDIVVERNGEKVVLHNLNLPNVELEDDNGVPYKYWGITFASEKATVWNVLKAGWNESIDTVRLVWLSLGDLVTGNVSLRDMSGVVGIVGMVNDVGEAGASGGGGFTGAFLYILRFFGFIAVNLAVMNLLPIPALDGGQILFLGIDKVYNLFTKKNLSQKVLGYINAAGFFLLIALMVVIAFSDVLKLFGW